MNVSISHVKLIFYAHTFSLPTNTVLAVFAHRLIIIKPQNKRASLKISSYCTNKTPVQIFSIIKPIK